MPYPDNTPRADDLMRLAPADVAALPVEHLARLQREVDAGLERAKALKARLDGALVHRYADRAADARQAEGKDAGTVQFDDGDFTVIADLPKRVEWDQAKLAQMVERIRDAKEDPAEYLEISYRVPERKYTAWPAAMREGFAPTRAVRTGKPSFRLVMGEAR